MEEKAMSRNVGKKFSGDNHLLSHGVLWSAVKSRGSEGYANGPTGIKREGANWLLRLAFFS